VRRTAAQLLIAENQSAALVNGYGFAPCDKFGV